MTRGTIAFIALAAGAVIFSLYFVMGGGGTKESEYSTWVDITGISVEREWTEYGGARIAISYTLNEADTAPDTPVYVFITYRKDFGEPWGMVPMDYLRGNGHGMVRSAGKKTSYWWGTGQTTFSELDNVRFRVRGIRMCRVPAGEFVMRSVPGGGYDAARTANRVSHLNEFYIARYETTVRMYADYLNEMSNEGEGWAPQMADSGFCGISRRGMFGKPSFEVDPGREDYPVTYVSWYDAASFLNWCGLRLPLEAEFEKAFRGGVYLDGDDIRQTPNPLPERTYPWGEDAPDDGGVFRCNAYGPEDGFDDTAPVGTFEAYNSPYGAADMAGNVSEWTLDWYTTSYHVGLDGYRMVRGGSWMDFSLICDAVTGATQSPVLETSIAGFRGAIGGREAGNYAADAK